MTWEGCPATFGKQVKPIIKARAEPVQRQNLHPRSGQFDCQRHSIEASANLDQRWDAFAGNGEVRLHCASALHKQLQGFVVSQALNARAQWVVRHSQARHLENLLASDPERLTA